MILYDFASYKLFMNLGCLCRGYMLSLSSSVICVVGPSEEDESYFMSLLGLTRNHIAGSLLSPIYSSMQLLIRFLRTRDWSWFWKSYCWFKLCSLFYEVSSWASELEDTYEVSFEHGKNLLSCWKQLSLVKHLRRMRAMTKEAVSIRKIPLKQRV